jgi:hypothetical protein
MGERSPPSRRAARRNISRASAPRSRASTRCPSATMRRSRRAIGPETAGILIEPVQGEGGIRPVPPQCLRGLRELCDANGLLLIFDEVQCGIGRTGKLFAHEWAGVAPDIMAIAKGIGGGFPLGACLATEKGGHDRRHARLDLRRQPAGHGGGQCRARRRAGRQGFSTGCRRCGPACWRAKLDGLKADEHPGVVIEEVRVPGADARALECRPCRTAMWCRRLPGRAPAHHQRPVKTSSGCCRRSSSPMPRSARPCRRFEQSLWRRLHPFQGCCSGGTGDVEPMTAAPKHFLDIGDLDRSTLQGILSASQAMKRGRQGPAEAACR